MAHGIENVIEALLAYHPEADVDLIQRAYEYSAKVHAGQVRKSGEPYLIHPVEVAFLLTKLHLGEASIVTGLLHDTVEDTLATVEDISSLFGSEVEQLVDGVTKLSQITFDTNEHKQAENFRKMLVAMAKDIRVILVKLCDRLHNMTTLHHLPPPKQRRIARETMDIYAPLANRLGIHWLKSQLQDKAFRYLYAEDYLALQERVDAMSLEREGYVQEVISILTKLFGEKKIPAQVQGRPKDLYSIHRKMASRHIEFEQVYDVVAFRVLVESVGHCYEVLGHVHSMWRPIPGRFKDYVAMPKPNSYQSLHTSVVGPHGERIEVQIRTQEMHRINEEGIAAHWEYKEKGPLAASGRDQFAWLRQLMEWQRELKDPNEFLDTVKFDLFTDEVFVFTPRGQVVSLQRGSTPVDFAYSIHTEVGNRCSGAKVNGRMVPLRYALKNGDMVEVTTHPGQKPSKDWLSFVCTGRAKTKIRAEVRKEERSRSKELGREILERELKKRGVSLQKLIKKGDLQRIVEDTRHRTIDGLFIALGYGKTTTGQVLDRLLPNKEEEKPETPLGKLINRVARRSTGGVVVQGLDDVLIRYGKCCSPLPGEAVTGFVTRGRGITVHGANCPRAIDADPERRIEVNWDERGTVERPVSVRVMTTDVPGLLASISKTFTENGVNISQANCRVTKPDRAVNTFEVMIKNSEQLHRVMAAIKQVRGVIGVERV
jgi:GTP diphosphokinase / guanosine-3',5'-bis(diphosphate) 3'-diphosphatase